jgi:hypothetical protein
MPVTPIDDQPTVTRNDEAGRYEIRKGDVLAGYTRFRIDSRGRLLFPHTEIDHAFQGQGLAKVLVRDAMADVAARGETVVPHCPFVARYLHENDVPGLNVEWPHPAQPE